MGRLPGGALGDRTSSRRSRSGQDEVERPSRRSVRGWDILYEVREALAEVREVSEHPPGDPGGVGIPSRRSGSGQKANPEVSEGLGHPLEGLGAIVEVREGSGGLPEGTRGVGKPSRRSRWGLEVCPEVQERSGCLPGGAVWDGTSSRMSGRFGTSTRRSWRGREAFQEVGEWSKGPTGGPGGIATSSQRSGRPLRRSEWCRYVLPVVRYGL